MSTFDALWETFPDENCVLTNRELLLEVRRTFSTVCCHTFTITVGNKTFQQLISI